jgi:hypothetical protein
MPESSSRESAKRIGEHIKESFSNYTGHWQEWMPPILVAAVVVIAAVVCCWLPYFIVAGPIACGLYGCAISAIRSGPVNVVRLNAGWRSAGSSIVAWLFITLGSALPVIVLVGCFVVFVAVLGSQMPPPQTTSGAASSPQAAESPEAPVRTADGRGAVPAPSPCREPPSALAVFATFFAILAFYAVMFLGIFVSWLWTLWFTTRTMFVLPLIADRRLAFGAALCRSWAETRHGFWELLLVKFVADVIGMLGVYAMYVGLLVTVPYRFTLLASVYEDRFGSAEAPVAG